MTNKLRISVFLMLLSILVIATFQGFWLKKNYEEQRKFLEARTGVLFRETVLAMQAIKLNMTYKVKLDDEEDLVSMTRELETKTGDSSRGKVKTSRAVVFLGRHDSQLPPPGDTLQEAAGPVKGYYQLFGKVDSLKEKISLRDVTGKFDSVLRKENIRVPYTITVVDSGSLKISPPPAFMAMNNKVTLGFFNPVTFQLNLGDTRWYLIRQMGQPLSISFLLVGITVMAFLILYRNLLQQRRLTALKNEFISNITHELKTPLATVSVAIEAMKNFNALQDPEKTREYLDISGNELQRLSLLVDKVLKLSMFEKQQVEINKEKFDLAQLVEEVVASMRLQLEKYKAQVAIEMEGTNFELEADRLHLTSVIFNLLDNALKYSKSIPGIQIKIRATAQALELSVTDNGQGIPAAYQGRIFEKFVRVPSGDRHNVKGYGLGLSYVAYVVKRHQGSLQLESQEGIGSRFTIVLPRTS
jgi:two-component system, OmpR family, phosphate regulon sensor histidine kinase PhoR